MRMVVLGARVGLLCALLIFAACGSDADESADEGAVVATGEPGETTELFGVEVDDAMLEAAQDEGLLLYYTSNPEDDATAIAEVFTEETGIEVSVFRQTAAPMLETIVAEHQRGELEAGIVNTGDTAAFFELIDLGIMAEFEPTGLENYSEESMVAAPHGYPDRVVLPSLGYNTDLVDGDQIDGFDALTDDQFRGQIAMPDPALTSIGFQTHWIYRAMVGEEAYVEFLRDLAENEPRWYSSGTPASDAIASGEMAMGWVPEGHMVQRFEAGAPVAISYAAEQLPAYVGTIGVTEDAPSPNAARLFVTFMLSEQAQTAWSGIYGAASAHEGVEDPRPHIDTEWYQKDYDPEKLFYDRDVRGQLEGREELLDTISSVFPAIGG